MGDYKHFFDTTWKKSHVETFSSGVFFYFTTNKLCFPEAADICLVSYICKIPLLWPTLLKCDENNLWLIYHLTSTFEVVTTVNSSIFHAHAFRETSRLTNSCSRRTFRSWIWSFCKIHVQTYWKPLYIYLQKYFKYCNELLTTRVQRTPWPARTTNDDGCEFDARLI